MDGPALDQVDGLLSVIGCQNVDVRPFQIDLKGLDDFFFVITNQNMVHDFSPLQ